jgi:hypothetical protein
MIKQESPKRYFIVPTGNILPSNNFYDSSSRSIFGTLEHRRKLISELNLCKASGDTVGVKMIENELGITNSSRPHDDDTKKMVHDMLNSMKARLLDPSLSASETFSMYSKLATLEKILGGEKVDLATIATLNTHAPTTQPPNMISQTSELYNFINSIEKRVEEKMTKFAPEDPLEKMKRDAEFFKMMGWKSPDEVSKIGVSDNIELKKVDNQFQLEKMKLDKEGKKYDSIKEILTDVITAVAEESAGDEFIDKKENKVLRSNRPSFNCLGEGCGQRIEFSHPETSRDITCPKCQKKHHYDHTKKEKQITALS